MTGQSLARPRPRLVAERPSWHGTVICPHGRIEPQHVGQFFFDRQNGVFYRANGPAADDWRLVTPAELPGSMVQSFVDFYGPAHHAMTDGELAEASKPVDVGDRKPHMLDESGAGEVGLRVKDARRWVAPGVVAMQCRVKLEIAGRTALFVGFGAGTPPTLPVAVADPDGADALTVYDASAVGVLFADDVSQSMFGIVDGVGISLSDHSARGRFHAVRVELREGSAEFPRQWAVVFVDDVEVARQPSDRDWRGLTPRAGFFRYMKSQS